VEANRKLVIGLGNPGRKYDRTRHNVGFMVVDALAKRLGMDWKHASSASRWGETTFNQQEIVLAKPKTFMNLSGRSIRELLRKYSAEVQNDLLIVSDDADLPFGRIRMRPKGTSGGHRGLESIMGVVETTEFARLRIGIGREEDQDTLKDFVLEKFSAEQKEELCDVLKRAQEAILVWLEEGCQEAMNQYNR